MRNIFLMLRQELRDSDIPHQTALRSRIEEVFDLHFEQLGKEMVVSFHLDILLSLLLKHAVGFYGQNIDNHGYVVWFKPCTIHGCNGTLDSRCLGGDCWCKEASVETESRLDWFPTCAWLTWWWAPGCGISVHHRSYQDHREGNLYLRRMTWHWFHFTTMIDWLGYPRQCCKQQHIYGSPSMSSQPSRCSVSSHKMSNSVCELINIWTYSLTSSQLFPTYRQFSLQGHFSSCYKP